MPVLVISLLLSFISSLAHEYSNLPDLEGETESALKLLSILYA